MPAWLWPAISAAGSLWGGISGGRSADRYRRDRNRWQQRAWDEAQQNRQRRQPFADAALASLNQPGFDAMQYYDPENYRYQGLSYNRSPFSQRARQELMNTDRVGKVRTLLGDFDEESAPVLQSQFRGAIQNAARGGALGKGTLNTELGEFTARRARDRDALQNQLIAQATDQQVDDAFRMEEIGRQESDADWARQFGERDYRTSLGRAALADRLALLGEGRAQDASSLARTLGLANIGYGGDNETIALLMQLAGLSGQNAMQAGQGASMNFSNLGQLLALLGYNRGSSASAYSPTGSRVNYDPRGQA